MTFASHHSVHSTCILNLFPLPLICFVYLDLEVFWVGTVYYSVCTVPVQYSGMGPCSQLVPRSYQNTNNNY